MEKIICAAVRFQGKVWYGHRHHHALEAMKDELSYVMNRKQMIDQRTGSDQGFVTSEGRYVGREEALEIAKRAGQVVNSDTDGQRLFSENLY